MHEGVWREKLKETDRLADQDVEGRIMLKRKLKESDCAS
jgi:hypothetical protein